VAKAGFIFYIVLANTRKRVSTRTGSTRKGDQYGTGWKPGLVGFHHRIFYPARFSSPHILPGTTTLRGSFSTVGFSNTYGFPFLKNSVLFYLFIVVYYSYTSFSTVGLSNIYYGWSFQHVVTGFPFLKNTY
jgi:hypothetical protein